jgi:hypothetical protein
MKKKASTAVKTMTTTLIIILDFLLNSGWNQIKGSINGPTQKNESTSDHVLKYHFSGLLLSISASLLPAYPSPQINPMLYA